MPLSPRQRHDFGAAGTGSKVIYTVVPDTD